MTWASLWWRIALLARMHTRRIGVLYRRWQHRRPARVEHRRVRRSTAMVVSTAIRRVQLEARMSVLPGEIRYVNNYVHNEYGDTPSLIWLKNRFVENE